MVRHSYIFKQRPKDEMSPVKRQSRKQDQQLRQDRGKCGRFAANQQTKTEPGSSIGHQKKSLQRKDSRRRSYDLRARQQHCPQCGHQFQTGLSLIGQNYNLCSGKDEECKHLDLLETCLTCRRKHLDERGSTNHLHSKKESKKLLGVTHTIKNNPRESHPEDFPDLDFHHSFGSFLTRKNPVVDSIEEDIGKYWALLNRSPTMLQYHIHNVGDRYREAFRRFFTAEPISLHGHVSDASSPAILTSLISHLTSSYSTSGDNPFLGEEDRANPCIAILEGSYGAGYGPLAHNSVLEFVRPLANGRTPIVIKTHNTAQIDDQVRRAKRHGCIALITEIVRARDGIVVNELAWKHLLRACKRNNLVLVVDEALTAIRCGAPFAYQLPQFQKHGFPDLVLFGKAVKTNGIAVDWRGINMQKLGVTDPEERLFMALQWQERLTEMAPPASLLTSWATIVLAAKEQWPRRSREIGVILRALIEAEGIEPSLIGGLHSLIYLRVQDQARIRSPVMGANAGNYVRWFPMMDAVMTSEKELRAKVFGAGSIAHRRDVSLYLAGEGVRLGFCSRCGQAVEVGLRPACQLCVVETCEDCEPGEHICPMEGMSR